jgi:hypothetical protein
VSQIVHSFDTIRTTFGRLRRPSRRALLNRQEPKPGGLLERVLHHSATDPGPRRKFIHAPSAVAVLADLIPDDAQHRQLAHRELAGETWRHRTARGEVPTPGNRDRTLRCSLEPPRREDRGTACWNAHRLDVAAYERPTGVKALGKLLGIVIAHGTGGEALPDRAGQVI